MHKEEKKNTTRATGIEYQMSNKIPSDDHTKYRLGTQSPLWILFTLKYQVPNAHLTLLNKGHVVTGVFLLINNWQDKGADFLSVSCLTNKSNGNP